MIQAIIRKNCRRFHSYHFIILVTKLLHVYVLYVNIVYVKYWINSSKAVVKVDPPVKVLSMQMFNYT